MEWRIFVPILPSISTEGLQHLFSELHDEIRLLEQGFSDEVEKRSDQYLIAHQNFGIKFRAEKKLELKVRVKRNEHGIEQWRKYKFGKKPILDQMDPICQALQESGHEEKIEVFRNRIVIGRALLVEKARKNFLLSGVCVEICTLQVASDRWLSVAVESPSPESIENFLIGGRMISFFNKLDEILHFCRNNEITSFQPLICGYPLWIQHVDAYFPFTTEEWNEAVAPLTLICNKCKRKG